MQDENTNPNRRAAIKGFAGASVAAVVWAEPTIKGLMKRPAYAASASGATTATVVMTVTMPADVFDPANPNLTPPTVTSTDDPFGYGPLTFEAGNNAVGDSYRVRIAPVQAAAGNTGVALDPAGDGNNASFVASPGTDQSPNNPRSGYIRWEPTAAGMTYMVTMQVSCP